MPVEFLGANGPPPNRPLSDQPFPPTNPPNINPTSPHPKPPEANPESAAPIAELVCRSSFSFQEGASTPEELVDRAGELGIGTLALTDRDGVYGLPRAHRRVQERLKEGLPSPRLICGARLTLQGGPGLVLLAQDPAGWRNLCRILTAARCGGDLHGAHAPHQREGVEKGYARLPLEHLLDQLDGLQVILTETWTPFAARRLRALLGDRLSIALSRHLDGQDNTREIAARELSRRCQIPLLATADVLYHRPERQRLQDILTATRLGLRLDEAGTLLAPNADRHLRGPAGFRALFAHAPEAVARACAVAATCHFSLSQIAYRYPREVVPDGHTAMSWLRHLCDQGLEERYPLGPPPSVAEQVERELGIIERLDFPAYFLTVNDTVRFARDRGILCQGRGSAANSAVCFVLGITAVDPASSDLLFERFISEERGEPPDIDVDFEHERREEVLQYVYSRYGRHRAAMVCNIITYRRRSAIRDVGKALGLSLDQVERMAAQSSWFDGRPLDEARLREAGVDPKDHRVRLTVELSEELRGHPRHLGLHSGGFTIADGPIIDLCPVEPASMPDRTVIQWDKDDLDTVGFIKVDLLALGMLTAIQRCFHLIRNAWGHPHDLASIPPEDPAVFDMLCKGDSVGVFQIESRAQMSMLPRLQPRTWYDLVIEVSIVRPGPIQGGMVHPYLRRRRGEEPVVYAHPLIEPILRRTLGVPIFQEQVMAMAVAVGGFTPGEADHLRRAMGAWRKRGGLTPLTDRLMAGMQKNGITAEWAERIAAQIQGFGEYGFPESHAASFARLVWVSSYLKHHYPAAFTAALLNSQPMGFYSPRSLVADARRHGVEVRPVLLEASHWDSTLEPTERGTGGFAIRLGFRLIKGLREEAIQSLLAARAAAPFVDLGDLFRRTSLTRGELSALISVGAMECFGNDRRQLLWAAEGLLSLPLFRGLLRSGEPAPVAAPGPREELRLEYAGAGLSVRHDPLAQLRPRLQAAGIQSVAQVLAAPDRHYARVAGIVSNRQRPGTASGIVFMTFEDETGMLNVVVKPDRFERQRNLILRENMLEVRGRLQRDGDSVSLLAASFRPLPAGETVPTRSRDFH